MAKRFDPDLLPAAPDLCFEMPLWAAGIQAIAGIDEAGRGALAGPVSAAAIILPTNPCLATRLKGVRDSKEMSPAERAAWAPRLQSIAIAWGVGLASAIEIDLQGIVPATRLAMQRALDALAVTPGHLLLDYLFLPDCPMPQTALIKGDARSLSIAAASILAKTTRDSWMTRLAVKYPEYGFAQHKGYGTAAHVQALKNLGPCAIHRLSFTPIREMATRTT